MSSTAKPAPHQMSLVEAGRAVANGSLSPVALLEDCLAQIAALDDQVHACIRVLADSALAEARAAEAEIAAGHYRGPLHGLPVGIKDIIDVAGVPTTCHSRLRLDHVARADSTAVARLRAAGAVFPAKLSTHEFAFGGGTFDLPFPPARNPWNTERHPGGSSSGSGAGVAARYFPAALGTDTGGSIRHPASHCGIVGMKPTYGRVSRHGVFPLAFTLDHVGPMTRTVADNALLLNILSAHDAADPGSVARPQEDFGRAMGEGLQGLTIGYVRHFHEHDMPAHPEMAAALDAAAATLEKLGAKLVDVTLPSLLEYSALNRVILCSEAAAIHEHWLREKPEDYGWLTRQRLLPGMFLTAGDYVQAQRRRREMTAAIDAAFGGVDLLLTASSMDPACSIENQADIDRTYPRQARSPFNLSGHPALAMMSGLSSDGLPLALQLVGRYWEEATIYRAAAAYEAASPWVAMAPPIAA